MVRSTDVIALKASDSCYCVLSWYRKGKRGAGTKSPKSFAAMPFHVRETHFLYKEGTTKRVISLRRAEL